MTTFKDEIRKVGNWIRNKDPDTGLGKTAAIDCKGVATYMIVDNDYVKSIDNANREPMNRIFEIKSSPEKTLVLAFVEGVSKESIEFVERIFRGRVKEIKRIAVESKQKASFDIQMQIEKVYRDKLRK